MVFYFLISIVFLAEVIIGLFLVITMVKADKEVLKYNAVIEEVKPSVKEVMVLAKKISAQLVELAPTIVISIKSVVTNIIIGQLKNTLGAFTFWLVKKEVEKHT